MKTTTLLILGAIALASVVVLAQDKSATPRIDKRERRQQKRIEQGEKSGQLTPKEAKRLERRENRIKRQETRAKAEGKMTPAERRKLTREQNRTSRAIYRKKHNARTAEHPTGK